MNHHSIPNRHQLRKVCLFRSWTSHGCALGVHVTPHHRLPPLTSNTVAFVGISTTCVARTCLYPRLFAHAVWGLRVCPRPLVLHSYLHACACPRPCVWHVRVRGRVTQCLLCTLALFVPGASCLQGTLYEKGEVCGSQCQS